MGAKSLIRRLVRGITGRKEPYNLDDRGSSAWHDRAKVAVELLEESGLPTRELPGVRIADLGCGDQKLRAHLRSAGLQFRYQGYDVYPLSDDVRPLNLDSDRLPENHDAAFVLGVFEYLANPLAALGMVRGASRFAIVSYTVGDSCAYTAEAVAKNGWKNHFTIAQLEELFRQAGFDCLARRRIDQDKVGMWLLKSRT
jgi:hypothetical protein